MRTRKLRLINRKLCFAFVTIMFLAILPGIHAQSLQFNTVRVGVEGSGKVYWSSTLEGAVYTSGSTDSETSIELVRGAIVTFTAVPDNGHSFYNWIVDSYTDGSNNPYVLWSTGASSSATVVADFGQELSANPPLQSPPTPIQYDTVRVGVEGSGKVYWSSTLDGVVYTSGSTDSETSIELERGAIVTFTAVPENGHTFYSWIVNSNNDGSNNPYVLWSTGASSSATVVADFGQA